MITKQDLRESSLKKRKAIEVYVKEKLDTSIRRHIVSAYQFAQAKVIAGYYPIQGEADLIPLLQSSGKSFVFPKVNGQNMVFVQAFSRDDFMPGVLGTREPKAKDPFTIKDIDLVLVPGILFDRLGHRLGFGKGYYDRLIQANPSLQTMGVCFDEFFIDELPADPWDAKMHFVATETGIYSTNREV